MNMVRQPKNIPQKVKFKTFIKKLIKNHEPQFHYNKVE